MAQRFGFWPCCAGDCECSAVERTYRVVMSGLSDNTSTDCTLFNGTHDIPIIDKNPSTEHCEATLDLGGSNGELIYLRFQINRAGSPFFVVQTDLVFQTDDGQAVYRNDGVQNFNCGFSLTSINMNLDGSPTICSGFPSTLTINAV